MFGLSGATTVKVLNTLGLAAPAAVHEITVVDGVVALKLPTDRYLVVATLAESARIEAALANAAPASTESLWAAWDIEAGIPTVVAATQEQFVPQTVNFDLIHAVSFDKGCYPGQEIVARTHYLGKVKQRMVRARLAPNTTPAPGDKLYTAQYGDQASGMIVTAARNEDGMHDVLAVIQASRTDTVHWQTPDGPTLEIVPLPYATA
jgi:folate-binding protein YgfZ